MNTQTQFEEGQILYPSKDRSSPIGDACTLTLHDPQRYLNSGMSGNVLESFPLPLKPSAEQHRMLAQFAAAMLGRKTQDTVIEIQGFVLESPPVYWKTLSDLLREYADRGIRIFIQTNWELGEMIFDISGKAVFTRSKEKAA